MSKQVRLRRGTTAQHAAFTGAEGELTYDTTKKILIVHDGILPGGRPLEGWVKLDPGDANVVQEIKSCLRITGGDSDTFGLSVAQPVSLAQLTVSGVAELQRLVLMQETLPFAATVNLDFRSPGSKRLALAGNVAFTTSHVGFGCEMLVRIVADGSTRSLSFPPGWKFVGSALPTAIAAAKTALLRLWAFGVTDADVVAHYLVEP